MVFDIHVDGYDYIKFHSSCSTSFQFTYSCDKDLLFVKDSEPKSEQIL